MSGLAGMEVWWVFRVRAGWNSGRREKVSARVASSIESARGRESNSSGRTDYDCLRFQCSGYTCNEASTIHTNSI